MEHQHHHEAARHHPQPGEMDQRRFLDLDAEVFGDNLVEVLDLSGIFEVRSAVDLGAGSGTGSRLMRKRFPLAEVTCVDNDPKMLDTLREQGFAIVQADLDDGFPTLSGSSAGGGAAGQESVDLVWASSSLHHVTHPARLLTGVRRALAPGGVLIVVELTDLPSFLAHSAESMLEGRCHAAAASEGWNHYPDWAPVIEAAGFDVTRSEVKTVATVTPAAQEYAKQWFTRFLHLESLNQEDRIAVRNLLERFPDDLELAPSTTRTAWIATPHRT